MHFLLKEQFSLYWITRSTKVAQLISMSQEKQRRGFSTCVHSHRLWTVWLLHLHSSPAFVNNDSRWRALSLTVGSRCSALLFLYVYSAKVGKILVTFYFPKFLDLHNSLCGWFTLSCLYYPKRCMCAMSWKRQEGGNDACEVLLRATHCRRLH